MTSIRILPEAAKYLPTQARARIIELSQDAADPDDDEAVGRFVSENDKVKDDLPLGKLVSGLVKALEPGKGWGWNLKHFSESTPLINNDKRMYLVPLSKGTVLTPGGSVTEGYYAYITDTPTISSNSIVIFIVPFPKPG